MDLFYEENYNAKLYDKGRKTVHSFSNTPFTKNVSGKYNITISKLIIYSTPAEIIAKSPDLYSIFYDTPNECGSSQYSEFISAILYQGVYNAKGFKSEGTIIKKLRLYHRNMDGISPPDIYMSNMKGKSILVSVTRFNSQVRHRVRAENLLTTKIVKSTSSIYATSPLYNNGPDRCIIQVFCKSEKNATILKNAWVNIVYIPSNIYLHIVICNHQKIYDDNAFY
jgi:hypothetical protein